MEVIIIVFNKKNLFRTNWAILDPKMAQPRNFGLALRILFLILQNKRGQEVDEIDVNDFFQKKFFWNN